PLLGLDLDRERVSGLVERNLHIARQPHPDPAPEALVAGLSDELDAFCAKFRDGGIEVVADQPELVFRLSVGRMDAELRRRQGEDQPAWVSLDEVPPDGVTQRGAQRVRLGSEEEDVGTGDRHQSVLTSAMRFVIDAFASPKSITVLGL